ncbi:LamG domain-containing protein [Archangium sp.]|uniref:LamG domain-containing protein n=1 Tax=Archangium sp. TaxID=1872627 RepID=UPI002EDBA7DB
MKSVILFAVVLAAAGCSSSSTPEEKVPAGSARFVIAVQQKQQNQRIQQLEASDVTRVEVTLDAFDIEPNAIPLVLDGNLWVGTMESIRAGTGRRFHAEAFDASDEKIYEGEVSGVTIVDGETVQVNILAQQVNRPPPLENEAPVIDSLVVSHPAVEPNGIITLKAAAHDPNPGDTLTYAWTATDGTFSDPSSLSNTWTAPATAGRVTLTLTVTDQLGVAAAISFDIRVERVGRGNANVFVSFNTWPEVTSLNATSTQVRVGQTITADVTTYDPDATAGTLSYSWSASCDGVWADGNSASAKFTPTKRPTDTTCNNCELTVTVTDGKGGVNNGKLAICVASMAEPTYPPQLASVYQSSKTVKEGTVVTLRVNATDTRSRHLTFKWSSNVGTLGTPATNTAGTTGEVLWATPSCLRSGVTPTVSVRVYADGTPDLYTDHSFTFAWSGKTCSGTGGDLCFDESKDYLARWTFDTTTLDSSIWGNHLQDFDADPFSSEGVWGQAAQTQGRFLAQRGEDDPELDFGTGSFTIAMWVKINTGWPTYDRWLLSKADDYGQTGGWSLRSYYGQIQWHSKEGTFRTDQALANNTWSHVAVVRDSTLGELRFYVNGQLDSTHAFPYAITDTAAALVVGARGSGASAISGSFDELTILQRAATQLELTSLVAKSCR